MKKSITKEDSWSGKTYEVLDSIVRNKMQEYIQDILEQEITVFWVEVIKADEKSKCGGML